MMYYEAIEILKGKYHSQRQCENHREHISDNHAISEAIEALQEIQQYRAIGTPDECRAAVEKQVGKKFLHTRQTAIAQTAKDFLQAYMDVKSIHAALIAGRLSDGRDQNERKSGN